MPKLVAAMLLFMAFLAGTAPADARTMSSQDVRAPVVLVDGGCGGPMYYRAINGFCYRKRFVYVAPPPRYYGCRYGFHPTPYGCRPNW